MAVPQPSKQTSIDAARAINGAKSASVSSAMDFTDNGKVSLTATITDPVNGTPDTRNPPLP